MCHWRCRGRVALVLVVVQCWVVCCGGEWTDDGVLSGPSTACSDFGPVNCTVQVLQSSSGDLASNRNVSCAIQPRIDVGIGGSSQRWSPLKDPLQQVQPYLYEIQRGGINDSLMMLNFTFSVVGWNYLDLDLFCPGLASNLSRRISVSGVPKEGTVTFDCPWMDLLAYRDHCKERMGLAYSTDGGSFVNTVTFPRPQTEAPFFMQRTTSATKFSLILTKAIEQRYLVCIRQANSQNVLSKFEVQSKGSELQCPSLTQPCIEISPKERLQDGPYLISVAEFGTNGVAPRYCEDSSVSWARLKFTVGSPPIVSAAVEKTIIAALVICGFIAVGMAVFLWRLKRRVVRKILWLTNVTWDEHLGVYNDLVSRVSRLNAFQSRDLVVEYGMKGTKNLERDLRESFAIVMLIGPRYFPDENEQWQKIYPEFHRHLAKTEFCSKLVLVQPEYLDGEVQLRGRETIVYTGRNVEDVAEAIAGNPDVIDLVKSPFYPSIRVADCVPAYVKAEKRVADYKKRFDIGKFAVVIPVDDY